MTKTPKWLGRASQRCSEKPWTLGSVIDEYRQSEAMSPEQAAVFLGCEVETLQWIALCRRPDSEGFADDVRQISQRFKIDESKLAQLIRRTEAITVLSRSKMIEEESLLLAARDRDEERER